MERERLTRMSLQPMFSIMVQLHILINYYSVPIGHWQKSVCILSIWLQSSQKSILTEDSFADLGSFYCLWPYLILASLAEYGNSDVLCVVIDEADWRGYSISLMMYRQITNFLLTTCFELPTEKGQKWCDTVTGRESVTSKA